MDLNTRISNFIKQILKQYKLTQRDLAGMLGISLGSLSGYVRAKEVPRIDVILRLAEIGGISVDDLLKTNKAPEKKEIVVNINGNSNVGGGIVYGDVYQNTTIRKSYRYTYQPGDLTEGQAAKIKQLVDEIVELEKITKKKPNSYAAVYNALKRTFKVGYYRKIREEDFEKAKAYLQRWKGRLKQAKSFSKKAPDEYRKKRYADIFAITKNEVGWSKKDVDDYIFEIYNVPSIRDLDNDQLQNLYQRVHTMKRKK